MTTTKDQLAALFRAEIERMLAHLDELALMARRFGNADDPGQLDADLEVGWAYRLLQLFGSRKPLSFEDGCPGRALLLRNGIPATNVDNIAATFLSEQQGMRNGVFEEQVKARMAEFDIPDTVLNRERALTEIFRAKADVLLDVGERYPMVDRERSAFTRAAEPPAGENTEPNASAQAHEADASVADAESPCPASSRNADVEAHEVKSEAALDSEPMPEAEAGMNNLAPEDDEGKAALDGAGLSAAEASEISAGADDVGSASADDTEAQEIISARGRVLPVGEFMASCEDMIANKGEEWTSDTAHDARVLVKIFQGILEEHGVAHSGEIEQFHIARLRNHFNEIPPRWGPRWLSDPPLTFQMVPVMGAGH